MPLNKEELESLHGKIRINNVLISKFKEEIDLLNENINIIKKSNISAEEKIKVLKNMDMYHSKISTYKRDIWNLESQNKLMLNIYRGREASRNQPTRYKPIPLTMEDMMNILGLLTMDIRSNEKLIKKMILLIDEHNPEYNQDSWMKKLKKFVLDQLAQESMVKRMEISTKMTLNKGRPTKNLLKMEDI